MNIRVVLNTDIADGSEVVFRSPADCSQVTGLVIYHNGGKTEFAFADAHGNNVGDIDHLFAENAVVKVILDVTARMAFVQNADTNAYIERTFVKTINGQAPDKKGNVKITVPEGGNGSTGNGGKDGGYYTPNVEQIDSETIKITFEPTDAEMPVVSPITISLPRGADGEKGDPGEKGEKGDPGIHGNDGAPGADGDNGYTPVKGVDYYTPTDKAEFVAYIASELAKRGQLRPEFANSVEDCREENKLYVLPDGYLYGYLLTEHVEGGYTNRIDTKDENFKIGARINASNEEVSTGYPNAFVSNHIPVVCNSSHHDMIRIRGVKDAEGTDGTRPRFRIMCYDAQGNLVVGFFMSNEATANNYILDKTTVEDGVYLYELGVSRNGNHDFDNRGISTIRIAGVATDGMEKVTVTVDEELIEATTVKKYAWANTGHAFIPGDYEERILAMEKESQELQGRMEGIKKDTEASFAEIRQEMEGLSRGQGGLRWFALGDSITEGWTSAVDASADSGYRQFLNSNADQRWVNIVAQMNGYELSNFGIGGTGYMRCKENAMNARQLADTLDFAQCHFVTLAYGVNDWKYAVNIGTAEDIPQTLFAAYDGHNELKLAENTPTYITVYKNGTLLEEGKDYVVGNGYLTLMEDSEKGDILDIYNAEESMVTNMSYVIKKILRDNPLCKIFVITPINCKSLGSYDTNWGIHYKGSASNGLGLEEIFALQNAVCEYHGIELIDMTHSSIVNRENIRSLLADSVHPTVEGHRLMARELSAKINFK